MLGENLSKCLFVPFSAGFHLVKSVSHPALGLYREWGSPTDPGKLTVFLKTAVQPPGQEMEFFSLRVEVDEEVVVVGCVPIPETDQSLDGPEGVEGIKVHQLPNRLLNIDQVILLKNINELIDLFSTESVLTGLLFKGLIPSFKKVHHRSFIQSPSVISKSSFQQWFA